MMPLHWILKKFPHNFWSSLKGVFNFFFAILRNLRGVVRLDHPASRAFLLLARFWRSRERLCMNRVRSLLNMRCMLPGYSLEPKPITPDLAAILVFHGTTGSIITIGFVTKRTLALEKPVWWEKTRLTSPEARAAAASKNWRDSGRAYFCPPQ